MTQQEYDAVDTMVAGPDIDRRVLAILGTDEFEGMSPSESCAVAFACAAKCELFGPRISNDERYGQTHYQQAYLTQMGEWWEVNEYVTSWYITTRIGCQPSIYSNHAWITQDTSLPLLICKAILKLRSP